MALDISSLLGGTIGSSIKTVVGAFKEDPTVKAQLQSVVDANEQTFKMAQLEAESAIQKEISDQVAAQVQVNLADAKGQWFQSSWRPLIGYICGAGLAYQILLRPMDNFFAQCFHSAATAQQLDMGTLMTLLTGMLGMGALRTQEKLQDKD